MLFAPPPGYNAAPVNRQNNQMQGIPGQQGIISQGYLGNPYRSSYSTPSSYAAPSSVPNPNQSFGSPAQSMIRALKGG